MRERWQPCAESVERVEVTTERLFFCGVTLKFHAVSATADHGLEDQRGCPEWCVVESEPYRADGFRAVIGYVCASHPIFYRPTTLIILLLVPVFGYRVTVAVKPIHHSLPLPYCPARDAPDVVVPNPIAFSEFRRRDASRVVGAQCGHVIGGEFRPEVGCVRFAEVTRWFVVALMLIPSGACAAW